MNILVIGNGFDLAHGLPTKYGFVGKVISDCIDITRNAIKSADKNRKSKNQTIETRIYQVTVDALNAFPYNKYKKDEKVYDAAESILKELKGGNGDYKESVRLGLNMLSAEITGDICEDFLELLCYEICKEENRDLAIGYIIRQEERISAQQQQMVRHMEEEFEESHKNEKEILEEVSGVKSLIKEMNGEKDYKTKNKRPIVNRADEYAKKWNENVFLNNFNEEDENAGVNIKLSDIYIEECLPHYIWRTNSQSKDALRNLLMKYIINIKDKKMLLILGQPGIGKSTLITWIMANLVEKKENILVYQFATDLNNIDWQSKNVLDDIFSTIGLEYDELENKTLLLDGFDEIYAGGDREKILNKLQQELKRLNILKSFSLIITCRENYIHYQHNLKCDYIVLQAWEETQIENFCRAYWGRCKRAILGSKIQKIQENKEIFGIPLILYMILALDIAIEKNSSIVDIYDQIFSVENGIIYERCYDTEHRINLLEIKEHIYRITQKMAFWIFENNADKAFISQEKFEEICDNEMNEYGENGKYIQSETLIGNFFKLKYSEGKGTDELQFVHRSIYEYFVAEYFYESIHKLASKEEVAGKLGELLKDGHLSQQILEFIKYKFNSVKGKYLLDNLIEVFDIMLQKGMTYYYIKEKKEPVVNILVREMNIFSNMLEIIHLWYNRLEHLDKKIVIYLQYNRLNILNLRGIDLNRVDLFGVDLRGSDLSEADLRGSDLRETNLVEADLRGANLSGVDLSEASLYGAELSGAYLGGTDLRGTNLNNAYLNRAYLAGANLARANLIGAELIGANLNGACLIGVDLSGAYLDGANLSGAYLEYAELSGTNLKETVFDEKQVNELCKKYDLSVCRVYISETEDIVSYKDYCTIESCG